MSTGTRALLAAILAVLLLPLILSSGCGSSSSANSNPTAPQPPKSPSPPPSPPPTPPLPPPPPTTIVGQVVDVHTLQPISGVVAVALEAMGGDFKLVMRTEADAQGNFTFNNVAPGNYAIVAEALTSQGQLSIPAILVSGGGAFGPGAAISPGTNVGKVPLSLPTMTPSTELLTGVVTSKDANGEPVSVKVTFDFPAFVADFIFIVPNPVTTPLLTMPNCSGDQNIACANFNVASPATTPFFGVFTPPNTVLQPFSGPPVFGLQANAFSVSTSLPDCTPPVQSTGTINASPGAVITVGPIQFTGCQ